MLANRRTLVILDNARNSAHVKDLVNLHTRRDHPKPRHAGSARVLDQPSGRDRYRFHDLLRAFATQCAEQDESADARSAALGLALNHYLAAAQQAHRYLCPGVLTPPELLVGRSLLR